MKNLTSSTHINLAYNECNDLPMQALYYSNPLFSAESIQPWVPAKNEDGTWNVEIPENSYTNPRANADFDDEWDHNLSFNGTAGLKWAPFKNLEIETKNSAELKNTEGRIYAASYSNAGADPEADTFLRNMYQITTSNTVTYSNLFAGKHSLRILAGQEAMKNHYSTEGITAQGVNPSMPYTSTASPDNTTIDITRATYTMISYFGIGDYNYANKYFAQATLRTDGSSLFGENNKWGLFWSVSGSWNVTAENFMKAFPAVTLLKLRASYGVNGNNGIEPYRALSMYSTAAYAGTVGLQTSQMENSNLSWEKNKTLDFGADFGVMDNKIRGSVDWYNRKTVDMLLSKQVPQTTGYSSIFTNVGALRNDGLEISLEGDIISKKDMTWTVGGNVAFNRTKILNLGEDQRISAAESGDGTFLYYVKGKSMYTYYLYDWCGVDPENGDALWYKEDGTTTNDLSEARKVYAGSPEAKATGGFYTSLTWNGFQLSANFEFKTGNKVFPREYRYLCADGEQMGMNQLACQNDYWKNPGEITDTPKPVAGNVSNSSTYNSTRWLQDGKYLRVKDVTVAYNLPKTITSKIKLSDVKFYISGMNLYCFNNVYAYDPEMGVTPGSQTGIYPLTKSIVGGIELTF